MGYYRVEVRDKAERRLRGYNVPHKISFSMSREDLAIGFLLPTPLKACKVPFLEVLKNVQGKAVVSSEGQ